MSRKPLSRLVPTRRGAAAVALVAVLPFTMAAGCEDEAAEAPIGEEEQLEEGGEEEDD